MRPIAEYRRPRPPLVRQRENFTCWAAALESWIGACYPGGAVSQQDLAAAFAAWQRHDGSLMHDGLNAIARAYAMAHETTTGRELTAPFLASRLERGPLFLVYRPTPGPVDGHIVVLYACGPAAVDIMDPLDGYIARPWEFLQSRIWAFVGWPARGVGGLL